MFDTVEARDAFLAALRDGTPLTTEGAVVISPEGGISIYFGDKAVEEALEHARRRDVVRQVTLHFGPLVP